MAASPADVARLAAGAKGGTAGVKAYDDAQKAVKASTHQAVAGIQDATAGFSGDTNGMMAGLERQVAAPGGIALANLARYGAADRAQTAQVNHGTSTYLDEAHAAIPVIDAEARLNEAQREAMLAASTQRAATKAPKALSDSELRNQLLGYAENQRADQAAGSVNREGKYVGNQEAVLANPSAGTTGSNQSSAARARSLGAPAPTQEMQDPAEIQQAIRNAQQQALARIQQKQYGPGITDEARQAGIAAGVDPNRVAGLLGPKEERSYLQSNEDLGLYRNPDAVMNTASDPIQTATALGYEPKQYRAAAAAKYVDWTGDHALRTAFNTWLTSDPAGVKAAGEDGATDDSLHKAFLDAHPGSDVSKNVVQSVIATAHSQIAKGMDYATFANVWQQDPVAREQPDAVRLGLAMVQQLFAYKQLADRQSALAPTGP